MVISELVRKIRSMLFDNAEFEAREIVMNVLDLSRSDLIVKANEQADEEKAKTALEYAGRRINGEPLQYILGFAEFMSLRFEVSRETLIPRSDTETLVEELLKDCKNCKSLLDIGTGTGCIGISAAYYNKNLDVTLADFKDSIIKTAGKNAEQNNVGVKLIKLDILNEIPNGTYDVIVSNPPYIESDVIPTLQTEVRDFEPLTALDGGDDGLKFYRRIVSVAPKFLNPDGRLFFEIGYNQGKAVSNLMEQSFTDVEVIKDLCGNDRVVKGKLRMRSA